MRALDDHRPPRPEHRRPLRRRKPNRHHQPTASPLPELQAERRPTDIQKKHIANAGVAVPNEVFVPNGREMCRDTGFRGRVGVFEVAFIDEKLSNAIAGGDSEIT